MIPRLFPKVARRARRTAVVVAWLGVLLGAGAGVLQLTYGSSIPEWTGDKMDTTGLGVATVLLSLLAGAGIGFLLSRAAPRDSWKRALLAAVALTCIIVCFTTVGRLWYVPGPLLIVATLLAVFSAPHARADEIR